MSKLRKLASAFALFTLEACQGEYPLAPTLCDDWCHLSESRECDFYSPSSCVRQCEEQGYSTRCSVHLETVMQCLKEHPPEESACGVISSARDGACAPALNALGECGFSQPPE